MAYKQFGAEKLLDRWGDRREISNLMGRVSAFYLYRQDSDIYDAFWSERADVCLGVNSGYYKGAENVQNYYRALGESIALESRLIQKAFPEQLGGMTEEEVYGVGMMNYKPIDTPIIELAYDGATAKGLWFIRGSYSKITPGGPVSYYNWGWFAVDFIKKSGQWKIWHMLEVYDVDFPCGPSWAEGKWEQYPDIPEFVEIWEFSMPEPSVPCEVRKHYSASREFTPLPRMPKPYGTFSDTFSYGI